MPSQTLNPIAFRRSMGVMAERNTQSQSTGLALVTQASESAEAVAGRIMSSLVDAGGLAAEGGLAGKGGGLAG